MFLEEDYEDQDTQNNNNSNNNNNPNSQNNNYSSSNNNNYSSQQQQKQRAVFNDDEIEDLDQLNITTQSKQSSQQLINTRQSQQQNSSQNLQNNSTTYTQSQQMSTKSSNSLQDKMKNRSYNQSYQDRIKDRNKQLNQTVQTTVQMDNHKNAHNPNSYHSGIDFSNLQQLQSTNNNQNQYEPGMNKKNIDDLPDLQPVDNQFQVQKEEFKGNLIISDDSDNELKNNTTEVKDKQDDENSKNDIIPADDLFSQSSDENDDEKTPQTGVIEDDDEEEDQENNDQMVNIDNTTNNQDQENEPEEEKNPDHIIAKPMDPNYEIPDMKTFLTNPLPKGILLQCTIKRDKSGMGHFYPKYHLYFSNRYQVVMAAKKRSGNKTSNYIIGMDKSKLDKKSPGFLGKVRSNFLGTEFTVFDTGENPKGSKVSFDQVRKELASVIYESNLLGAKGPRKMKVLTPQINPETEEPIVWKPLKEQDSLLFKYKNGNADGINYYYNKPPKWNEHVQAFVLNFNGRVDKPSVKNFQLVDEIDDERIYLQFGRVGNDVFNMDLQYPLSPLQAFGICLSSFDYKIACE